MTAARGSISSAAKELHISQPALSFQLRQFESSVEIPLFDRSRKGIELTPEGKIVFYYAESIFSAGEELKTRLKEMRATSALEIGYLYFLPKIYIYKLLKFLETSGADISLTAGSSEVLLKKLEGGVLAMILSDAMISLWQGYGIETKLTGSFPVHLFAREDTAKHCEKIPGDLQNVAFILPTNTSPVYKILQNYLIMNKISPKISGQIEDRKLAYNTLFEKDVVGAFNSFELSHYGRYNIKRLTKIPLGYDEVFFITTKRKKTNPLIQKVFEDFKY